MLLTPPDIISQSLLAVPMWLLFELGVIMGRIFTRGRKDELDDEFEAAEAEEMANRSGNSADKS